MESFFVHLATIVVGLLIAVGLEQTVEYFLARRKEDRKHKLVQRDSQQFHDTATGD